jgi:hypothetical protein
MTLSPTHWTHSNLDTEPQINFLLDSNQSSPFQGPGSFEAGVAAGVGAIAKFWKSREWTLTSSVSKCCQCVMIWVPERKTGTGRKCSSNTCNTTPAKCRHMIHFTRLITCLWTCMVNFHLMQLQIEVAPYHWYCKPCLKGCYPCQQYKNVYPDLDLSPKHNQNSNSDQP